MIAFIYSDKSSVLYSHEHEQYFVFYSFLMYFAPINLLSTVSHKQLILFNNFPYQIMLHMSGNTHIKLTAVFTEHSNLEGVITPFSTSTA